jgi:ATP-dependent Clp protease, protease subunit
MNLGKSQIFPRNLESLDLSQNIEPIWVHGFTESDSKSFCKDVLAKAALSREEPILIFIDSYGGAVDECLGMIDVLSSIPNPVITVAVGKAMSCGAMILSAGDIRYVSPNARVMIHETSSQAAGHIKDSANTFQENKRLNDHFMELLSRNCGFESFKDLEKVLASKRDIYMSAHQAVKFGIADHVGLPMIQKTIRYNLKVSNKNATKTKENKK